MPTTRKNFVKFHFFCYRFEKLLHFCGWGILQHVFILVLLIVYCGKSVGGGGEGRQHIFVKAHSHTTEAVAFPLNSILFFTPPTFRLPLDDRRGKKFAAVVVRSEEKLKIFHFVIVFPFDYRPHFDAEKLQQISYLMAK